MRALALTVAVLLGGAAQAQTIELLPGEALLEIQATGQALVQPDIAHIFVGVVSTGTTAREATDANARQMTAVIAAIRRAGLGDRDVRTQQINVQPSFAQANREGGFRELPQINGYVARNTVVVTARDLAKAPDVVAAAFGAGANSVSGPNLALRDEGAAIAAARTDAIEKARFEANAYAEGLGMRVTRVLRVSERGRGAQPYDIVVTGSRVGAPPPPPPAPPPPIERGEIMQTLNLWVDFAIAPL